MREHVQESRKEVSHTIEKIDAFGAGMREANQKIANTFRTFADKPTVDYSQREQKFSKTEIVKKPWLAQKKLLEAVEVRLDGAIDKVENLSRAVEINKMLDTYDKVMEKEHSEQEQTAPLAMVAEPDHQYGADVFDAYMKEQKAEPGRTEAAVKPEKEKNKAR
jgi:BioD-like phosphotransacetylase family protein